MGWHRLFVSSPCLVTNACVAAAIASQRKYKHRASVSCNANVGEPKETRIVVIGGGVVGASIAYHLARRARQPRRAHVKIILVDSGQDHRASNMTWGYANSFWKKPLNYHDLNQLSVQAWPAFLNLLGCSDAGKHGALMFAVDEPAACALKDRLSAAQSLGHSVQEISEKEASQIVGPGVKLRQSKLTAYCEDELIVNAEYVARCACAKLHELNAVHVHSRVEKLRVNSGQVVGVVLSDGRCLEADVVVISAGCGSQELAASAGISLPVECTHDAPSYGQSILPNHGLDIPFLLRVSTSGKGQLVFDQLITRNDGRVMLDSGASGRNHSDRAHGHLEGVCAPSF
mmetsp:Transcript_75940/g.210848  ORF Transcript_75940/g.210848 Transcript_75940/m.210848 type:complete len:344 (-) Transcript_75940:230-1261(-)